MLSAKLRNGARGPELVGEFIGAIHVHEVRRSAVGQDNDAVLLEVTATGYLNETDALSPQQWQDVPLTERTGICVLVPGLCCQYQQFIKSAWSRPGFQEPPYEDGGRFDTHSPRQNRVHIRSIRKPGTRPGSSVMQRHAAVRGSWISRS